MNYPRHIIGNQGMDPRALTQNFTPGTGFEAANTFPMYPGIGESQFSLAPVTQPSSASGGLSKGLASLIGGGSTGSSGSGFSLAQLKSLVDRLGGVEGIVDTFSKMQKMMQGVQQMAPMLKLLMTSFGKGNKGGENLAPVRKKRRKRKGPVRRRKR